jgi:hypothetical protein
VDEKFSGKFIRLPRTSHARLAARAKSEDIPFTWLFA